LRGWHWDELGEFPEVLGGGGEEELVVSSVWSAQAQAIQPQDPLQMAEQHFDLLPFSL
jgi:hypothetical protein